MSQPTRPPRPGSMRERPLAADLVGLLVLGVTGGAVGDELEDLGDGRELEFLLLLGRFLDAVLLQGLVVDDEFLAPGFGGRGGPRRGFRPGCRRAAPASRPGPGETHSRAAPRPAAHSSSPADLLCFTVYWACGARGATARSPRRDFDLRVAARLDFGFFCGGGVGHGPRARASHTGAGG